jgi:Mce-associated membrane protein
VVRPGRGLEAMMDGSENSGVGLSSKNEMAKDAEEQLVAGEKMSDAAADALALAEEAEAEAAAAEAAAARARARAVRLRQQAVAAEPEPPENAAGDDVPDDRNELNAAGSEPGGNTTQPGQVTVDEAEVDRVAPAAEPAPSRRRRLRRSWGRRLRLPGRSALAVGLAVVLICAMLGASGYMAWHHHNVMAERQRSAQFAAAARQGVVNLMTLDFNNAKEGVQRIIDDSTGSFSDDFRARADDFIKVVQDSKVVTEATVNATAIQSMTPDSAVVLVAATSRVTNSAGAQKDPRAWRLSVTVTKDGGQIKMSKAEFVP